MTILKFHTIRSASLSVCTAMGLILAVFIGFSLADQGTAAPMSLPSGTQPPLGSLITEYRKLIREMDQERLELQRDVDWLEMKIQQTRDLDRHVPEGMMVSKEKKTFRVQALGKSRQDLEKRLHDLEARVSEPGPISEETLPGTDRGSSVTEPGSNPCPGAKDLVDGIRRKLTLAGLADWVSLVTDGGCVRLESRLPILFPTGSAVIAVEYQEFLKKLAGMLLEYDVKIQVEGYADIQSINTGKYPSNFELGAQRAANVVHALVGYGIKPSVFQIGSTGRYRFKAKGMSSQKVMERRADLVVVFAG
ncbi:MAG: OmpA family protein [Pseudomonadota bacterium]